MLNAEANIEAKDEDGETPLHGAVISNNAETLKTLLKAGANIEARNEVGFTPVHRAALWGDAETVTTLLKAGANGKAIDKGGNTPFDRAKYNDALNGTDAYRMLNEGRD